MTEAQPSLERRLETLRALISNPTTRPPAAELVDMQVLSLEAGRVRLQYAVKPEFMHPGQAVQGGIVTMYADMAMALAGETLCAEGEFLTTTQLSISFLAPVRRGPVFADGTVAKKGRTTFFMESVVTDAEGKEMARATSIGVAVRLPSQA